MKRLFVVIGTLLVLPAFAEVIPQYVSEEEPELMDQEIVPDDDTPVQETKPIQRTTGNPRMSTRSTLSRTGATGATVSAATSPRAVSGRGISSRSAVGRTAATRGVSARSAKTSVTARASTAPRVTARAALTTSNASLYNSNGVTATTNARVSARNSAIRVATNNAVTATSVDSAVTTTDELDELAELTDYCKSQYALCMDNYCGVLDDNQARCSCSSNLSNYAKTETALAEATEALQEVAQQIQYIGLSADNIETLFNETEAEIAMNGTTDKTNLKTSLDSVKRMIVDVKTGTKSSSGTAGGISLDMSGLFDFTIDSSGFDLSSFLGSTTGTASTSSISNQRGANLYKTATARCKASVLNACTAQGVDPAMVTNYYDLQIDKDCLAYERALTESNDNMSATVRNAQAVLKKARLMVAQNKNQYDLRGCVEELDNCMQSDFVCGSDYSLCLDPTGKYIVNGSVVVGSTPGVAGNNTSGVYETWGTAWSSTGSLSEYINSKVTKDTKKFETVSEDMAEFLQNKIGYHDDDDKRDYGMCISVLNQCQNYTYTRKGNDYIYNPENQVVKEYLARTLTQIKAAQDTILSEHAEDCLSDVASCLTSNGYATSKNIAIQACSAIIKTCMSVNNNGSPETGLADWVDEIMQ